MKPESSRTLLAEESKGCAAVRHRVAGWMSLVALVLAAGACERSQGGSAGTKTGQQRSSPTSHRGASSVPVLPKAARKAEIPSDARAAKQRPSTNAAAIPRWRRLAEMWLHPNPLPNFRLLNQDGKTFQLADLAKNYLLIGFIFTTCGNPKACPLTTQKMHDVGRLWQAKVKQQKTAGRSLHLLTCTIDPDSDTPAVLKSYSEALRKKVPGWTFATGPDELMSEVLPGMFGVRRGKKESRTKMAHSVKVALLKPGLRPYKEWRDNNFAPSELVELVLK